MGWPWVTLLGSIVSVVATASAPLASPSGPDAVAPAPAPALRVTLLGTAAGPAARSTRSQPASLLQVGGKTYLIDAGDGVLRQLASAGVQPGAVDAIFITHLHFDHTAGLPAFLAFDWQNRRRDPVTILGPAGTHDLVRDAIKVFQSSVDIFHSQQPDLASFASLFKTREIVTDRPAEVYDDGVIRVRAVANTHYTTMHLPRRTYGVDRSYSYRVEAGGKSLVFTGDTGPSAAVEDLARGAQVLVSEVIDLEAIVEKLRQRASATSVDQSELIAHMAKEHLTPEEVGKLATRAGVGKVVLTHIATPPGVEADTTMLVAKVREHFSGEVVAGYDLYSF